jgi:potassium efflux system protein
MKIRATTITDWDRKEYVVPNKEFIIGRVLNWTLSDQVNRVVINVGVAYGSDTERARTVLQQIAHAHPLVLKTPPPRATFEQFGDSSLTIVLRLFLPNLEHRTDVVHDLHTAIHKRFAEEGIEIAFPQLELHVRSAVPEVLQKRPKAA